MADKRKKSKETLIMIRLPDVDDRQGIGTLTIQRDELGLLQQFDYKGLTLKGNIAEAVGTALLKLTLVEATPPPNLLAEGTENSASVSTPTDTESVDDDDESVSSDVHEAEEDENPSEMAETAATLEDIPVDELSNKNEKVSAVEKSADASTNHLQISLF